MPTTVDFPELRSQRLTLRLPTPEDIPALLKFFTINRDFLAPWRPTFNADFFTREFWTVRIEDTRRSFAQGKNIKLLIFSHEDQWNIVGTVNFNEIVRGAMHGCYLGYELARKEQGKGLMTEALRTAIPYVFETGKLHRVMANYMPHNVRSAAVLKRLGFVIEGYARDYLYMNGAWQDHILTSITNGDWVSSSGV